MDIKEIKDDLFLKNMNYDELNSLAKDIRSFILENVSKTGGHLSSNLGDVELIIALHKCFDLNNDKLLFDVGHQAYTHKILTGRANKFDTLRKINGLSGFLSKSESPYDVFESGHSSTSISTAMGMATARDANNLNYEIIDVIGDGSIANGVSFEALNNISNSKNKIIIVLNDNDMAINESVGAMAKSLNSVRTSKTYGKAKNKFLKIFKKSPKFISFIERFIHRLALIFRSDNLFDNFNISYLGPVDGHDFKQLEKAFKKAKEYPNSILVHVKTKKGYGYEYSLKDDFGKYHGVSPFDIKTGEELHHVEMSFTIKASNIIYDLLKNDKDVFLISSAMVYCTNLSKCFSDFNDRCIDVGIAEEHSIAYANGLALANKKPIVSIYSTFMQRGYDEIVHDVCRINSNITFFVDRAGIVGEDGKTHQGIFDVSFLYPLENSIITMVSSIRYFKGLINCLDQINGPKFIRYQKLEANDEDDILNVEFGKFIYEIFDENYTKTIIAVGNSCEKLKELIQKRNLKINLINPIFLKPIDTKCLNKIKNTQIYLYDNTSVYSGFCSEIVKFYNNINKSVTIFCLKDEFISFGNYYDVLKSLSLDEEAILGKII
ncbi:MAG: 1-deoxy-D-xylulose-5-phosphate synthase [Candidatus Caccosoma sp.]|nr:1-deoxy-D-xylulose-5-phosphate synthase [Candidatus Caccosoma sp.]